VNIVWDTLVGLPLADWVVAWAAGWQAGWLGKWLVGNWMVEYFLGWSMASAVATAVAVANGAAGASPVAAALLASAFIARSAPPAGHKQSILQQLGHTENLSAPRAQDDALLPQASAAQAAVTTKGQQSLGVLTN
jgi:hypothetical protein